MTPVNSQFVPLTYVINLNDIINKKFKKTFYAQIVSIFHDFKSSAAPTI